MLQGLKKVFGATVILATAIISQQALNHDHLLNATPADKIVVSDSPKELTLKFTEGIEPSFSGVALMSAAGDAVSVGKIAVDSADNKVLHVPLTTPLKAGAYMVDWHVLSVDGHKTHGSYDFTLK